MRVGTLCVGMTLYVAACVSPPPTPTTSPDAPPTSSGPRSSGSSARSTSTVSAPAEPPQPFGLAADAVVVIQWEGGRTKHTRQTSGEAYVLLPTGERLAGPWRTMDSNVRRESPTDSAVAQHANEDPGDPASMPGGRSPATIVLIELRGDLGTRVSCTIPIGRRSKSKIGKCHSPDARHFSARMR
ncbi:MAG: hypothetical protein JKY37_14290 [Nannocystaceae bacterium]|nr:hypothetical protein [Nannocystaceae bacterium]